MSKLDTTKYNNMVSNASSSTVISSTVFKAFIDDVKSVIDGNDDLRISHAATNAFDAHGYNPAARVYHSANQSIANTTFTTLAFNSERYDNDGEHDNTTNNSRLTCKTAGKYRITANVQFASNATGYREVFFLVNGTTAIADIIQDANASFATTMSLSTTYELAVNDYVEVRVYQNSGGALNVSAVGNYSPEFMMEKVG